MATTVRVRALVLALAAVAGARADYPPLLDPSEYTSWTSTSNDGLSRRAAVAVPFVNGSGAEDVVALTRLDLVGDAGQRGFAQVERGKHQAGGTGEVLF